MSTRWQITAKTGSGEYGSIYVHCDGYPEHALGVLRAHYNEQGKIDALIASGDHMSIGESPSTSRPFSSYPDEDWEDIKPTYGDDPVQVSKSHAHGDEEYFYFWDGSSWTPA